MVSVRNPKGFLSFNDNIMSSLSTKRLKAKKSFRISYVNPCCVGSPGVFITPGTYLILFFRLQTDNKLDFEARADLS